MLFKEETIHDNCTNLKMLKKESDNTDCCKDSYMDFWDSECYRVNISRDK